MVASYRTANEEVAKTDTDRRFSDRVDDPLASMHAVADRLNAVKYILDNITTETETLARDVPKLAEMVNGIVHVPLVGALAVLYDAMEEHAKGMERLLQISEELSAAERGAA